jgi:uncharacterized membrane protein
VAREANARRREENEVEFSRIVAFSDGVFAIAITLLVLPLGVPEQLHGQALGDALWEQRHDLFAFALSFAVVGRFWLVHHRFFGEVTGFDGRLLSLNLFYLAWIVLIPFSSQVLGGHSGETAAVVLYAGNMAAVVLAGAWTFSDARRAGFSTAGPEQARETAERSLIIAGVFLLSIPVAFLNAEIAQLLWIALFLEPVRQLAGRRA